MSTSTVRYGDEFNNSVRESLDKAYTIIQDMQINFDNAYPDQITEEERATMDILDQLENLQRMFAEK